MSVVQMLQEKYLKINKVIHLKSQLFVQWLNWNIIIV